MMRLALALAAVLHRVCVRYTEIVNFFVWGRRLCAAPAVGAM